MKDRHEFRVVLEGVALDDEQAAAIETAVREAALLAASRASVNDVGYVTVHPRAVNNRLRWRGIWILGEKIAREPIEQVVEQNQKSIR